MITVLIIPQRIDSAALQWTILGLAVGEAALILIEQCASEAVLSRGLSGVLGASHEDVGGQGLRLTWSSTAACLLGIAGGLIRRSCHRALGRFFTWEMSIYNGHRLITTGPYRVVRHPSYTGLALLVVGIALLLTSSGSLFVEAGLWDTGFGKALVVVFVAHLSWTAGELLWRTRAEDEMMRAHFGREWEEWAKRTPYRVLPLVY